MNADTGDFQSSAYRRGNRYPAFDYCRDAVIGGLDERWSLLSFGLGTVGAAIALRWWLIQQRHRTTSASFTTLPAAQFLASINYLH